MQFLISAPPRTGKSQYAVYLIDKFSKQFPNRTIYTNIIGMNYPGVISISSTLHKPFDWRDLPNGSILFYDECHEHPAFSDDDLLKDYEVNVSEYDSLISKISNNVIDIYVTSFIEEYMHHHNFADQQIKAMKASLIIDKKIPIDYKKSFIEYVNKKKKIKLVREKERILDIGRSLTLHGHFGIDIYMITQDVKRVNATVKAATSKHYVLRRMFGWDMAFIFEFAEVQTYFAASTRKGAIKWSVFRYKPNLYKYYISSEEHNVQKSMPLGFVVVIVFCLSLLSLAIYKIYSKNVLGLGKKTEEKEQTQQNSEKKTDAEQFALQQERNAKLKNCIDSGNSFEQCQNSNQVTTTEARITDNQQNNSTTMQNVYFEYDPNNPYDTKFKANYQPTDFPIFSHAIVYDGKCYAYSQQATRMHDVSQKDCLRFATGDHPFNYFNQPNQQQQQQQQQQQYQTQQLNQYQQQKMTATQYAKYLDYLEKNDNQQANNYVQEHLSSRNVNGSNSNGGTY